MKKHISFLTSEALHRNTRLYCLENNTNIRELFHEFLSTLQTTKYPNGLRIFEPAIPTQETSIKPLSSEALSFISTLVDSKKPLFQLIYNNKMLKSDVMKKLKFEPAKLQSYLGVIKNKKTPITFSERYQLVRNKKENTIVILDL